MGKSSKTENNPKATPNNFDQRVLANPERTAESEQRLEAVDRVARDYQAAHKFIEGATVFGSTVHGGASAESDIDAFVFVDPDGLPEEFTTPSEDGSRHLSERDAKDMGRAMQVDFMQVIGKQVVKDGAYEKNDVQVFAVNEKVIIKKLEDFSQLIDEYQKYRQQREKLMDDYYSQDYSNDRAPFDEYAIERLGAEPEYPGSIDWSVAALFHPGVGDTARLTELRGCVIETLSSLPAGQAIWEDIMDRVAMFEGDLRDNDKVKASKPNSLEAAAKTYKI